MDNSPFLYPKYDFTVIRRVFHKDKDNKIDLSDIYNDMTNKQSKVNTTKEELLILLDVSKTTAIKNTINNEYYQKLLKDYTDSVIRQYGKSTVEKFKALVKDPSMLSLFKLKLFDIVCKNNPKYKIKIICFSKGTYCSDERKDKNFKEKGIENLKDAIDFIDDSKNKELLNTNTTNFLNLLKYLNDYNNNLPYADYTKAPQENLVFLTDYLHDKTNENDASKIVEGIKNLFVKRIYSNIFFYGESRSPHKNEINIYPLFFNAVNGYTIKELPINSDIKDNYPLSKTSIPLYYEDINTPNLQTEITFKKIKDKQKMIFFLKCDSNYFNLCDNNIKQIIENKEIDVDNKTVLLLLYNEGTKKDIENKETHFLGIENNNCLIRININFIKDLFEWSKWIITLLLISMFISLLIHFKVASLLLGSADEYGGKSGDGSANTLVPPNNGSGDTYDKKDNNIPDAENDKDTPQFPIGYDPKRESNEKGKVNNE